MRKRQSLFLQSNTKWIFTQSKSGTGIWFQNPELHQQGLSLYTVAYQKKTVTRSLYNTTHDEILYIKCYNLLTTTTFKQQHTQTNMYKSCNIILIRPRQWLYRLRYTSDGCLAFSHYRPTMFAACRCNAVAVASWRTPRTSHVPTNRQIIPINVKNKAVTDCRQ